MLDEFQSSIDNKNPFWICESVCESSPTIIVIQVLISIWYLSNCKSKLDSRSFIWLLFYHLSTNVNSIEVHISACSGVCGNGYESKGFKEFQISWDWIVYNSHLHLLFPFSILYHLFSIGFNSPEPSTRDK